MKIPFFVVIRAAGTGNHKAVSSVVRSLSRDVIEEKLKRLHPDIEIITIIAVCQINEMCK